MRVLIADDEELVIEFLERSLRLDRHIVDTAKNGLEIIEKTKDNTYDVIVTDVIMPVKNGLDVCRELRQNDINTPIIMLTSRDSEAARVTGLNAGADDYLAKPFSYKELEARIRAVARRPHPLQSDTLVVGNIALDTSKKVITMNGEPLTLRPKEFALLEYLIRNSGKVVSKDELLKNVWRIPATNASNRLEVCMYHLRNKVNDRAKKQMLKTIRGYGYVLEGS